MFKFKSLLSIPLLFSATALLAGCSSHATGIQKQVHDVGGMTVTLSVRPGLPQDMSSYPEDSAAQVGDNTLIIELHDDKTEAPIPNANINAFASTSLVGQESTQSGRAQGNGLYYVPIRFGVPDTYGVTVMIDRPQKPETTTQFMVQAG